MIALAQRSIMPLLWVTLFMATLALLFAVEPVVWRIYDAANPPLTMTWAMDGTAAVRFSGVKHRDNCSLIDVMAWDSHVRLRIEREDGPHNQVLPIGPFGPSSPWLLSPPPQGELRIVAEYDCDGRVVLVEANRAP